MDIVLGKGVKPIRYAAEGFYQILKFSYHKERIFPNGTKSMYSVSRRVQIRYIGLREQLHKFQLGVIKSEFSLSRTAEPTADLSNQLHRALALLVLGANAKGQLIKVYNLSYVHYIWNELKKDFFQNYDKQEYIGLIKEMDHCISEEKRLIDYLQLPTMYGLYFNNYWEKESDNTLLLKKLAYGNELSEAIVDESLIYHVKQNQIQEQTSIDINLNNIEAGMHIQNYSGTCIYLDGVLDTCKKEIQTDSTKFYYSAKWVGLKKLFQ